MQWLLTSSESDKLTMQRVAHVAASRSSIRAATTAVQCPACAIAGHSAARKPRSRQSDAPRIFRRSHGNFASSSSAPGGSNTISPEEVSHFASLAQTWWDEKGDFNVLQRMNKVRVEFLRERLGFDDPTLVAVPKFLEGKRVLDVGCGGGLFSERLARLGASTLAVDASEENVMTARLHASQDPHLRSLLDNGLLEYRAAAAEHLLTGLEETPVEQFDVVCAMEVLEHVSDPPTFLRCLAKLVKPGGHLVMSTIARTPLAKFLTIQLAESSLVRLAPAGSHTYSQFILPSELVDFFKNDLAWHPDQHKDPKGHLTPDQKSLRYNMEVRGTTYLPWKGEWTLLQRDDGGVLGELSKSVNYFFGARKPLDFPAA